MAPIANRPPQTRTTRSGFTLLHYHNPWPGVTGYLNINKVSDATYFTDLSNRISATSQTFLPREGWMQFNGQGYGLYVRALSYQTLQDPLSPVVEPYRCAAHNIFSAKGSSLVTRAPNSRNSSRL